MERDRRSEIVTGLFVCAAVVVFGLFAFRVGRFEWLSFLKGHRITAVTGFPEAKTLSIGARVLVAGRSVGEVTAIRLVQRPMTDDDVARVAREMPGTSPSSGQLRTTVEVTFDIVDGELRIDPETARVALAQDGFLGNHFLDLTPGFFTPEALPPKVSERPAGDQLTLRPIESGALDTLLPLITETVQAARDVLTGVDEHFLGVTNRDAIAAMLRDFAGVAASLRALLDVGNADGVQASLIRPAQRTLDALEGAVVNADRELRANALPKLDSLLDRSGKALDEASKLVTDLRTAVGDVQRDVQSLLQSGERVVAENRVNLADSLLRLRGAMWQAELALRKVRANPAVLLFGDSESDLEAAPIDATNARRSGRAGIYPQRGEGDGGK